MNKINKPTPDFQEIIDKINRWRDVIFYMTPSNEDVIFAKDNISTKHLKYYQDFYKSTLFFNEVDFQKCIGYDLSNRLWIKDNKYKYQTEINEYINNNIFEMSKDQLINEFTVYYNKLFNIKKNPYAFMWITIRPTTETRFSQFFKLVEKSFRKKWITRYIYVFEQKSNNKEKIGDGFHIHALTDIPDNKPNHEIYREFRNTFKHVCGPKGLYFKPMVESLRADKLQYIGCTEDYKFIDPNTYDFKLKDGKPDIQKCECLPFDEQFKIENNLELCYTN